MVKLRKFHKACEVMDRELAERVASLKMVWIAKWYECIGSWQRIWIYN